MLALLLTTSLQHLADQLLAPFATLGTVTTATAAAAAFFAKSEAVERGMSPAAEDTHIQRALNQGVIAGFALSFIPVCILFRRSAHVRSLRHLLALCLASGAVCLVVLATGAPRLWLAAGPALLGVLDAAAFSGPVRRAGRHLATVALSSRPLVAARSVPMARAPAANPSPVLAVCALAAGALVVAVIFIRGWAWWLVGGPLLVLARAALALSRHRKSARRVSHPVAAAGYPLVHLGSGAAKAPFLASRLASQPDLGR